MKKLALAVIALPLAAAPALAQQNPRSHAQQQSQQQPQRQSQQSAPQNSNMQGNQNAAANLSQDEIRQVQQALGQKGFNAGRADGKLGPKTENALNQFQKKNGLQASGQPDDQTLAALGIGGAGSTTGQAPAGQQNAPSQNQQPSTQQQPPGQK